MQNPTIVGDGIASYDGNRGANTLSNAAAESAAKSKTENEYSSYDSDLGWIVERLVERVGGLFGVVSRHLASDDAGWVLACGPGEECKKQPLLRGICQAAHSAVNFGSPGSFDSPRVSQASFNIVDGTDDSYRIMCLSFSPSASVNLVASVVRRGASVPFAHVQSTIAEHFYPVLARYVQLWWMHREERSRAVAYQTALHTCDVGVLILDRRLELHFANFRASALLEEGSGLHLHGRRIVADSTDDGVKLQAAMLHAHHFNISSRPNDRKRQRAPILTLRRKDGRRALIVTVLGLERAAMDATDPAVILYVLDPARDVMELLTPLCNIYKLTSAESRLVYWLITGLTLAGAAAKMNIQQATARSYLKQIFAKTLTNRQAELVSLFLSSLQRINTRIDLTLV